MKSVIAIPTYNERENIETIVRAIMALDCGLYVIVVDDNSPDGTGEIAEMLADEFPGMVSVLHRERKEGLGPAYVHAFRVALADGADYVFEMDADYSHDPKYLPAMMEAATRYDVVIGSRYVPGGGTVNWGVIRRFISKGGSAYARLFTGMKIRDCTAGFRCYSRKVLESIDFSRVSAAGYGFQVEMTYICTLKRFSIVEVPIVFADRVHGKSKMNKSIVFEAMVLVAGFRRKYRDLRKAAKGAGAR